MCSRGSGVMTMWCCCLEVSTYRICFGMVFFFQAEDGIRDLVRSRGLGDVYKRQVVDVEVRAAGELERLAVAPARIEPAVARERGNRAVSYTHLTLPTSDLV